MCRLFGFRSVISSGVHTSLIDADNALAVQSTDHPDGWGVAYYLRDIPHVVKSSKAALNDSIFKKVSGIVSSETVLAHIRKTTVGKNNILNTHPFQFGQWVFAHNGHIVDFAAKKEKFKESICPKLRSYILGETDTEYIFYFLLTKMSRYMSLSASKVDMDLLLNIIKEATEEIEEMTGEASKDSDRGDKANYFTFILTNGKVMLGQQKGKKLHYSTYKKKCPESSTCSSYNNSCEHEVISGEVNHLIISSEPLHGENIWKELKFGQIVAVDHQMKFYLK